MADRKVSVNGLAELMGVNRVTLSGWKNADTMPMIDGDRLDTFCQLLNCTPADLIEYQSSEEK
jgi:putative transcriptional regulator